MDLEYDRKFEEMKGYIPFLESMIKRLESTSSASNPRQAQLNKIRSLRDLLLDKKKRMKMENLLKCEQVLINLYAKVEQRDSYPKPKIEACPPQKGKTDLSTVRNKLKSVVSKLNDESSETLPEIARASKTEEVCVPGSKEPALFQRRPNKSLQSVACHSVVEKNDLSPQSSKSRSYTRVLHSPEPAARWPSNEKLADKPLFSRRSPRKSPRRYSPSYLKKERKKASKQKLKRDHSKDLNITLKVPQESLSSLSTKDILSRIINCSDSDVDIGTLRELRTQILGELKQTGSKDDITDILLRSYKNKVATNLKETKPVEVEEGEISDSESEAIENIYSSILITDNEDKSSVSVTDNSSDKQKPRKIQIRLVIDSDNNTSEDKNKNKNFSIDITDFETYNVKNEEITKVVSTVEFKPQSEDTLPSVQNENICKEEGTTESNQKSIINEKKIVDVRVCAENSFAITEQESSTKQSTNNHDSRPINFYTSLEDQDLKDSQKRDNSLKATDSSISQSEKVSSPVKESISGETKDTYETNKMQSVDIPLLNFEETTKKEVASEIDILQALKNEILSETTTVLSTDTVTPALHQPKITKVTNALEVGSKKRISIEKYKANAINSAVKNDLFANSKDDICKKQSLKLTEKECERFNFLSKLALDESSEDEDKSSVSVEDIYGSLAPKSPDHEDFADTGLKPPVIIPNDPVEKPVVNLDADVDMRKLLPKLQPAVHISVKSENDINISQNSDNIKLPLVDPRIRRDLNPSKESPNPYSVIEKSRQTYSSLTSTLPTSNLIASNMTACIPSTTHNKSPSMAPIMTPIMTPILTPILTPIMTPIMTSSMNPMMTPSMTPNARSYEVTPSRLAIENEDYSLNKHVYAPLFTNFDTRDNEKSHEGQVHTWGSAENRIPVWEEQDLRNNSMQNDDDLQNTRSDRYSYEKRESYNRMECPPTPNHPFGRLECPSTPNPSFGRIEASVSTVHPFNRCDGPINQNSSFDGQFGRSDYSQKPTSSHNYGKNNDSRWNKTSEYEVNDEKEWRYYNDRGFGSSSYKNNTNARPYGNYDSYNHYHREQSIGKSDRNIMNEASRRYVREQVPCRESSDGRSMKKEFETDRFYSNNRNSGRRDENRVQTDVKGFNSKRSYYEHNTVRTTSSDEKYSRLSGGRSYPKENKFEMQTHGDRFNKIDTNHRRSFKDSGSGSSDRNPNFKDRRQRAASVGRTLERDSSIDKSLEVKFTTVKDTMTMNRSFRRASSVGREVVNVKSFKDIKADLKSFKLTSDKISERMSSKINNQKEDSRKFRESSISRESSKSREPRYKKDMYNSYKHGVYNNNNSPRKNNRDPRLRHNSRFDNRERCREYGRSSSKESRNYGIVYSNDNISKGTILGSGYGVKNYKIPKIKRTSVETDPIETNSEKNKNLSIIEKEVKSIPTSKVIKPVKNASSNVSSKETKSKVEHPIKGNHSCDKEDANADSKTPKNPLNTKEDSSYKKKDTEEEINIDRKYDQKESNKDQSKLSTSESLNEHTEKRVTRFGSKSVNKNLENESPIKRTRRARKACIYDSDSDEQSVKIDAPTTSEEKNECNSNLRPNSNIASKINDSKVELVISEKLMSSADKEKEIKLVEDSSFAEADLDIFSENNASDSVIDNINALIADLDHDLNTSKDSNKSNFTDAMDTMLQSITCGENDRNSLINGMDTMLQNITCGENDSSASQTVSLNTQESNQQIQMNSNDSKTEETTVFADVIPHLLLKSSPNLDIQDIEKNVVNKRDDEKHQTSVPLKSTQSYINDDDKSSLDKHDKIGIQDSCNESIVSTTEKEFCQVEYENNDPEVISNDNLSTPDSTINSSNIKTKKCQEVFPDSTDETGFESNANITSTINVVGENDKNVLEPSTSSNDIPNQIDSIGKLFSILQDKSKINELLLMLGDKSSENEKIKKKLEKLSKIVEEDEDIQTETMNKEQVKESVANEANIFQVQSEEIAPPENKENGNKDKNDAFSTKPIQKQNETNAEDGNDKNSIKDSIEPSPSCVSVPGSKSVVELIEPVVTEDTTKSIEVPKELQNLNVDETEAVINKVPKKRKPRKRGRGKKLNKAPLAKDPSLTRTGITDAMAEKPAKKPSRELKSLQDDIKEMFMKEDILNTIGVRMCRLAKISDEKNSKNDPITLENEPVVILEKYKKLSDATLGNFDMDKLNRKKITKEKDKNIDTDSFTNIEVKSNRPGPKSKTKVSEKTIDDPYAFETDSVSGSNVSENKYDSSVIDSDNDSAESVKSTENEVLSEIKKKVKRKRSSKGWQAGIIKPKNRKKKTNSKHTFKSPEDSPVLQKNSDVHIPDPNCFTDKTYCFDKNISTYSCRLCIFNGSDIVNHYKNNHPHSEIPLSRINSRTAMQAINQSENINVEAIIKIPSKNYVCRFCFKEFNKKNNPLETFFWHIVSKHTGEYKRLCSECINVTPCPFNLDIPPPPKYSKGQLIGYICKKCNFTQISLENLKTHVVIRHRDEQTEVYKINLSEMTNKTMKAFIRSCESQKIGSNSEKPRVLRSSRSNQSMTEQSDVESDSSEENIVHDKLQVTMESTDEFNEEKLTQKKNIQLKLTFENDNENDISEKQTDSTSVKIEPNLHESQQDGPNSVTPTEEKCEVATVSNITENIPSIKEPKESSSSCDILDYPHFKIKHTASGSKEYVCCINGAENHYRTALLISFKKHVQLKHSEKWDGYCFVCKVIVTPQGNHNFKDCLQHFLDMHMDNFPLFEESILEKTVSCDDVSIPDETVIAAKSYINVRPLSQLISIQADPEHTKENNLVLPVIESVISLGTTIEQPAPSPSYPIVETAQIEKEYKYEETQADIMSKKHRVVLDAMMSHVKLAQIFKCAGRFCSFTTDSAEDALLHASTHMRIGGENALNCTYCDFDSCGNAIDLITHVFRNHGCCQYVCGMCFYRAAASQLVNAHIKRVHENAITVVLQSSNVTGSTNENNMLTREAAVPLYLCNESDSDSLCKFRTYTPGKFFEHLQARHAAAIHLTCFICQALMASPKELIRHLKTHGLRLYQCTWCVFGADTEADLLAHASAKHPTKQPKAYLRIITNKEGTTEFRVLPMAQLNKLNVPAVEVAPNTNKENPVREADRSIELENLIGQTTHMIETMTNSTTATSFTPEPSITTESDVIAPLTDLERILTCTPVLQQRIITPPPSRTETNNIFDSQSLTPIIKTETDTSDNSPEKELVQTPEAKADIVYCLDSEEENSVQNIVDLSDDGIISSGQPILTAVVQQNDDEIKKLPQPLLYRCANCSSLYKTGSGFKKHLMACFSHIAGPISCAHCHNKFDKKDITKHYTSIHLQKKQIDYQVICPQCQQKFSSVALVKQHMKTHHLAAPSASKQQIHVKEVPSPVSGTDTVAPMSRRKRSLESREKTLEPSEKVKKYGPQDVDRLPINPILDDFVHCSLCGFSTKVRLNMVRHLQLHAQQQPVPQTAPINPVPHLETNEKHFDKMVNLASSSIVSKAPDKTTKSDNSATLIIPPEAASRYPKYVPDRVRHACGAKGCSYISVNESMLKCHWEALHDGTYDFHCVHCPPHQQLDTRRPLTAARIIAHLKMHDVNLYACSLCPYYHFKVEMLEKHFADLHKGGHVMIVRGELAPTSSNQPIAAPTMDLKPWQCGLCKFKSLLRPEVVDHCAKVHNSKMQYKCAYCAFRTSNFENIPKHQAKSHIGEQEAIFYYYYREGEIADGSDGTPLWEKQRQKMEVSGHHIKSESELESSTRPTQPVVTSVTAPNVDLNIVKKEIDDSNGEAIAELCKEFGEFCEPNGLKYKCSLCKNVTDDNLDTMQSHLFEELKYRKWGCSICSYKAFHKTGFNEHMQTEHRQNREPIELQVNSRIETWVAKLLQYQTTAIEKKKENLAKQKKEILRANLGSTLSKNQKLAELNPKNAVATAEPSQNYSDIKQLENTFGDFGSPRNLFFCCPKCNTTCKEENDMQIHLEGELNKIRWCCNCCSLTFQTYHEAQFHCRSAHVGQSSRPVEATRDAALRSNWVAAVIKTQKHLLDSAATQNVEKELPLSCAMIPEAPDNSLLVVRYEERIPTPEEQMARVNPAATPDSDEDNFVIDDEAEYAKKKVFNNCPYCSYITVHQRFLHDHILRHYSLKPFLCAYCGLNGYKKFLEKHQKIVHPTKTIKLTITEIPIMPPAEYLKKTNLTDSVEVTCLVCLKSFAESESQLHHHDNTKPDFGKQGDVVVKCCVCSMLHKDVNVYINHHKACHPEVGVNYVFSKLSSDTTRDAHSCNVCNQKFASSNDLTTHKETVHAAQHIGPGTSNSLIDWDDEIANVRKRKIEDTSITSPIKRVAKKSTSRLPGAFAKKSTTKLPFVEVSDEGYSYYGQNPSVDDLDKSILIPFCNTMIPITVKKLPEIFGKPVVHVKNLTKK